MAKRLWANLVSNLLEPKGGYMLQSIAQSWWLYALRGVAAIIFGVLAFVSPGSTLLALVLVFGIYAVVDGVLAVISSFQIREVSNRWWVVLLEGLAGVIVGIVAILYPSLTAGVLLLLIAFWAVFTGIMEIIAAIRLRQEIDNEWSLVLSGILSIILGVILVVYPSSGAVGLVWAVGLYAIFFGVLMLYLAFQLRGYLRQAAA
jgi:uncharacterized membrane protein HdeD (DUF308 family)